MNKVNLFNSTPNSSPYYIQNYFGLFKEKQISEISQQQENFQSKESTQPFLFSTASKTISVSSFIIPIISAFTTAVSTFSYGFKVTVFPNSLENKLAEKLDDINRARTLVGFYNKIQKTLSSDDQHLFENWLFKYCQVLSRIVAKEERLLEELNSPAFQEASFKSQIIEFLKGIDKELPVQQGAKRIAILYTGLGGGGHKAPATAIKEKLIQEKYTVEMIDTDEVEKEFEPKIFGRGHEDIWTEFYQRKGQPALANLMWKLHHFLYHPEWRKTTQVVRNKLAAFNPDLIFSVADHKPQFASLAYSLNKKMIFVHTDNKFTSKLKEIAQTQSIFKNALVKFTKPTTAEPANYEKTLPQISGIKEQLIPLQIPVRQGFKKITLSQQNEIKKEMGLDPSVKICLIMMGNNGIESEVHSILNKIYDERHEAKERVHLIFVCGRNQSLANELSSYNKFEGTAITMDVKGFLDGTQMAKVAQSADVWLTKMGGSTSSEALAMRKQVLSVSIPSHKCEARNALANQACGLSDPLNKNEKILSQIYKACQKPFPTCHIPDWEEQLMQILPPDTFSIRIRKLFTQSLSKLVRFSGL